MDDLFASQTNDPAARVAQLRTELEHHIIRMILLRFFRVPFLIIQGLLKFAPFFFYLLKNFVDILPVKSGSGGSLRNTVCAHQGG